ncbi:hypothetical protein CK510_22455 [Brunnivagina elsteri CCALA 953]|uniref:Uncharacterized protein n=1 Tax=Brunnivagina elsteri CCALA 953 TaxID=987040 RepID=A0A2A2TDJ1_9CYAN|nr:hypothetical protein CK510_22455 [Calothrix elsteri CCALA 953]
MKAKEVVSIQLNGASTPPPRPMLEARAANFSKDSATTPIVAGEQQVEASVTLQISY